MSKCDGCGGAGRFYPWKRLEGGPPYRRPGEGGPDALRTIEVRLDYPPVGRTYAVTYHAARLECRNRAVHRLQEGVFGRA